MLSINSGIYKGRKLKSFKTISPTTAKVRCAVLNIVQSYVMKNELKDYTFVDLFCGTGAVGLEALSRGAAHAILVDNNTTHLKIVQENCESLKINNQNITLIQSDLRKLPFDPNSAQIIFMDPPYGLNLAESVLDSIIASKTSALIIVEEHRRVDFPERFNKITLDVRTYGDTKILVLQQND